jgi:VanZ family protein
MLAIFFLSAQPRAELPFFPGWDYAIKKAAHMLGYGLLGLSYLHLLGGRSYVSAWALALLYAASDEFHQSFVPGRSASVVDVLVFDHLGAIFALLLHFRCSKVDPDEIYAE